VLTRAARRRDSPPRGNPPARASGPRASGAAQVRRVVDGAPTLELLDRSMERLAFPVRAATEPHCLEPQRPWPRRCSRANRAVRACPHQLVAWARRRPSVGASRRCEFDTGRSTPPSLRNARMTTMPAGAQTAERCERSSTAQPTRTTETANTDECSTSCAGNRPRAVGVGREARAAEVPTHP